MLQGKDTTYTIVAQSDEGVWAPFSGRESHLFPKGFVDMGHGVATAGGGEEGWERVAEG